MGTNFTMRHGLTAFLLALAAVAAAAADDWYWVGGCGTNGWYEMCYGDTECSPGQTWRWNNWGDWACPPNTPAFPGAADNVHVGSLAALWHESAPTEVHNVYIGVAGELSVQNGGQLSIFGPLVQNDGEFWLRYGGTAGNGYLTIPADVTFDGPGVVRSDGGTIEGPGTLHVVATHTIRGHGLDVRAALDHAGLLASDHAQGVIALSQAAKTNSGVLKAANGGKLDISTLIAQAAAGQIVGDGGQVRLFSGSAITGGVLDTAAEGVIFADYSTCTLNNVTNEGHLRVGNGGTFTMQGMLTNNGQLDVYYGGYAGRGNLAFDTNATLAGTGEVLLEGAHFIGSGTATIGAGQYVHGYNSEILVALDNSGAIVSDVENGSIWLRDAAKTNRNLLKATGGGYLDISVPVEQVGGGQIVADGGHVRLCSGSTVTGGVLDTANDGQIYADYQSCTLTDVTNEGELRVGNGGTITVQGALTNNGRLGVYYGGYAGNGNLAFNTDATLTGIGEVQFSGANLVGSATATIGAGQNVHGYSAGFSVAFDNFGAITSDATNGAISLHTTPKTNRNLLQAAAGAFLDIYVPVTQLDNGRIVADGGSVRLKNGSVINGGALETSNGGQIYADYQTTTLYDVTNRGALAAGNGGVLNAGGALTNDGTIALYYGGYAGNGRLQLETSTSISGTGTLDLAAGDVTTAAGAFLLNGLDHTITGTGPVWVDLTNWGIVAPGNGVGTLPVNAHYTQAFTGTLRIQLGGLAQYDRLAVGGPAALDGTLRLALVNGFLPQPGQQFVVLTAGAVAGQFAAVVGPGRYAASYGANQVTVTVLNGLGDTDCSGGVTFDDINPFVMALSDPEGYQAMYPNCDPQTADCNADGAVTFDDINPFVDILSAE